MNTPGEVCLKLVTKVKGSSCEVVAVMGQYAGPVIWGAVGVFELWAARRRPDLTLSRTVKRAFRTDDAVGRAAFLLSWVSLAVWFCKHIIRDVSK